MTILKEKIIYYSDEREEFSGTDFNGKPFGGDYEYIRDGFGVRFLYNVIARPAAFLYAKLVMRQKTVGREKLKDFKKAGIFVYGNHTQRTGDPFMPNVFLFPHRVYFVVNPDNLKVPVIGRFTPALGALPLPEGIRAYRNFLSAIDRRTDEGGAVVIYPEAHIWPYYTKIRDFPDTSFGYPCRNDMPVFCFTNTYKKSRIFRKPRVVTYVDGPFYPDRSVPANDRPKELRDRVYGAMCERARHSDCEYIRYVKKEN